MSGSDHTMLDAIQLHRVKRGEHDDVRRLLEAGFAELGHELDDSHYAELADLAGHYAQAVFLVAHAGDRIVGCAVMEPVEPQRGRIARLSVVREWRQHGLGGRLLDALLDAAQAIGYREVDLTVPSSWLEVIRFFSRRGFDTVTHGVDTRMRFVID